MSIMLEEGKKLITQIAQNTKIRHWRAQLRDLDSKPAPSISLHILFFVLAQYRRRSESLYSRSGLKNGLSQSQTTLHLAQLNFFCVHRSQKGARLNVFLRTPKEFKCKCSL